VDEGLVYLVFGLMAIAAIIAAIVAVIGLLISAGLILLAGIALVGAASGLVVASKNFFEVLAEAHTVVPGPPGTSKKYQTAFIGLFVLALLLAVAGVAQFFLSDAEAVPQTFIEAPSASPPPPPPATPAPAATREEMVVVPVEKAADMSTVSGFGAFSESGRVVARQTTVLRNPGSSPAIWGRRISIWDGSTGALVKSIELSGQDALSEVFALDRMGARIAAEDGNGGVHIWNVSTGQVTASTETGRNRVSALAFDEAGVRLAIGRQDGVVEVWDIDAGTAVRELRGHSDGIRALKFSPDGELLVSGSGGNSDFSARVWNSRTFTLVKLLENIGGMASTIAFSNDGRMMAVAMWDTVSVWSIPDIERVSTMPFESRHNPVTAVAFDPSGTTIFTAHPFGGGEDVRRWDVRSAKLLNTMNLEDGECYFPLIEFAESGRVLLTACKDIRRWPLSPASAADSAVTEWRGTVGTSPATFEIRATAAGKTGRVTYQGVIEELSVAETAGGAIVLTGTTYQRLTGTGSFSLDTFSGQVAQDGRTMAGSYVDASGNRGQWNVSRTDGVGEGQLSPALSTAQSRWIGAYSQAGSETTFVASLTLDNQVLAGSIEERSGGSTRQAVISGTVVGAVVRFQKTYSGGQTVSYVANFAADGRSARGTWTTGSLQGDWQMRLE
jgi:hypothetical protein